MIDLYFWPTPNGYKITIMLEECGLPYTIVPVNIGAGDQFKPDFLKISPNNRMPAIVDHEGEGGPLSVFESGAILLYLAEKTGRFIGQNTAARIRAMEWLFWQMGGLGPMMGQLSHFTSYAPQISDSDHSYSLERYRNESLRLFGVMDRKLGEEGYLAGEYSIADMASLPWVKAYERLKLPLRDFQNLYRWYDELMARPAVKKAYEAGKELQNDRALTEDAKKLLFGKPN